MKALPGGRWEVTVEVVAKKLVADALGKEAAAPLNDLIDIGAVDQDGNAIAVERTRVTSEKSTFTLVVDRKPAKAGIDPLNKLIDRRPDDNAVPISGA